MSRRGERTQLAILEAASGLLREHGPARVTMADVAAAANLTRQALYLHFPTRGRLMVALIQHVGRQLGSQEVFAPVEAARGAFDELERALHAVATYAPRMHPFAVALDLARHTDPDVAAAWEDRMAQRRKRLHEIVARHAKRPGLRAGWTVARATDALWTLTSPGTYADFVVERGNSVASYEQFLYVTARALFAG